LASLGRHLSFAARPKYIVKLSPKLYECCFWAIGDDALQHAWIDKGMQIVEHVSHVPTTLENKKVCDLVDEDGNWKWNILQGWLPREIINRIAAILLL
jgi:hypothetical protein